MTRIEELLDQAVAAAPPSRLRADEVFRAGRRRRSQRRMGASLAGVICVGVAVALVGVGAGGGNQPAVTSPPGPVRWVGFGDANHLYIITNTCELNPFVSASPDLMRSQPQSPTPTAQSSVPSSPVSPPGSCDELSASSDGGATWQSRGAFPSGGFRGGIEVIGPETLIVRTLVPVSLGPTGPIPTKRVWQASFDGGASWSAISESEQAMEAVPPGGGVVQSFDTVRVLDPVSRTVRPLAHLPSLLSSYAVSERAANGLWVTGLDPATHLPALAVSHDGGHTWTVKVMPGAPEVPVQNNRAGTAFLPYPASRDGQTAYATLLVAGPVPSATPSPSPGSSSPTTQWVFRTVDGGVTWQAVDPSDSVADGASAWVTADGRHVVSQFDALVDGVAVHRFLVSADGQTYTNATLPGLPVTAETTDGYVARTDHAVYLTDDGWTWREVWHD
jgi:hypothetical protein